ncbi:MAG TPA: PAS domain S-box protein [Ideonella sp.]|nr:PAS domain S-box protein [Ideonella sp.]
MPYLTPRYDPWVVAASVLIASFASYVALDLAKRVRTADRSVALSWWVGGSIAMGTGIWAMHFVGMLAFTLPIALGYTKPLTFVSWVAAVVVSMVALWVASRGSFTLPRLAGGSLAMGAGICGMHYIGMAAMDMAPGIVWDASLVAASAGIAVGASAAALLIFYWLREVGEWRGLVYQAAAAIVMGLAICGMHYTGMAAASFPDGTVCLSADALSGTTLGTLVVLATVTLLSLTLFTSIVHARMQASSARLEHSEGRIRSILAHASDAFIGMDHRGLITEWNRQAEATFGWGRAGVLGRSLADLIVPPGMRARYNAGLHDFVSTGTGPVVNNRIEVMALHRDGHEIPIELSIGVLRTPEGFVAHAFLHDISERKDAEAKLAASSKRLRDITDHLPALISYLDRDLCFRFVNKTYQDWFGNDREKMIGLSLREYHGDEVWAQIEPYVQAALAGREVTCEWEMIALAGRRHVQATLVPERDARGDVMGLYTLISDITPHREAEQALQASEARLRTVADALPMRVAYIDADERYRFNNLAYERGFGLSRDRIQGRTVRELLGDAAYPSVEPHIRAVLRGKAVTFQSEMTTGDSYVCYEANYVPQFAVNGEAVVGFHAVITDITRQKLEEKRLVNLARIDALTGVANRAGFELRLAEAMGVSRSSGVLMALMYLDIDRFKQINDRLGHNTGDALLRAFAGRLLVTLRSSDTVARLGGDEFTVILEGLPKPELGATVAAKIVHAMKTPFVIEQQTINVTTSIGLAFYQGGATTADALVRQADEMLYQAKGAGRNNVQVALRLIEKGRA